MLSRMAFLLAVALSSIARASIDVEHFSASTDQPGTAWIGKALADGLSADLIDLSDASALRITGSYQTINTQVRVNGQLFDRDGKLIGTIRAEGDTNDLFRLEDALSESARKLILRANRQIAAAAHASMPAGGNDQAARLKSDDDRSPARLTYTGGLIRNPRVNNEPKLTDPNARAATWRYYYSQPTWYWGCGYSCYGNYSRGYFRGFGGRPAFIFAGYQGSTLGAG